MRSLKKVLALLTVIAMIFSTTAAFGATFKDVDGTDYEAAVVTLSSLDVLNGYEDGTFKPEGDITRAEFAKVIIAVMNMTASAGKTATSFTDVGADNWASGYVKLAEQMGVIKGYGNGKFGPDDKVTYEQAVKMIVAALGFTPKAEALGGYPTGYMVVAAQEEITKGIKADASKAASRGVVAQLVYNALEVEMMEQTGYGTDVTYEQGEKTLLKDYLEVTVYEEVQVIANEYTSLTSATGGVDEDKVKIMIDDNDNDTLKNNPYTVETNGTNAAQLLGYIVDVYVNDDDEIISINKSDDMNVELEVMADDIVSYVVATNVFTYEDENEEDEDVDIKATADVIKNGKATALTKTNLEPTAGKVLLLDTDDNEEYDVVLVTKTENEVVDEVIEARDKVNYKDDFGGASDTFDPDDDDYSFVILKDGEEIELKELKEWDILSIAKSDGTVDVLYTVYVTSGEKVEGKVTEEDDGDKYIDGKKYELGENITQAQVTLGDEGTFYLDMYGKIAAYDTETESENYAVVLEVGATSGLDSGWEIMLLNNKGEEVTLKLNDKVDFNGNGSTEDQDVVTEAITGLVALGHLTLNDGKYVLDLDTTKIGLPVTSVNTPAFVTYELNSDGEIDELDIVIADSEAVATNAKYNEDDESLGTSFYIDEDTIVFNLDNTFTDYDDFEVKGKSYFNDDEPYTAYAYDVENGVAKVVRVVASTSGTTIGANYALIEKVTSTRNADDDTVYRLRGYADSKAFDILTDEDLTESKNMVGSGKLKLSMTASDRLTAGYLISYKTSGEVADEFSVIADLETKDSYVSTTTDLKDDVVFGTVYEVTSRTVKVGNAPTSSVYYTASKAEVYSYDKSEEKFEVIELSDISKEDTVCIFQYDGDVEIVVVIED